MVLLEYLITHESELSSTCMSWTSVGGSVKVMRYLTQETLLDDVTKKKQGNWDYRTTENAA